VRGQRHAPAAFHPRKTPYTHCTGGWVGPRAGLNRCVKSRFPPGFDLRTVQFVVSRYTDWAIWPTRCFFKSLLTSMFHYKITTLHAKSFLLQFLVTLTNTVYIYPICQSLVTRILQFLFTKYPYVCFTTSKDILLKLTIYKTSKFIVFTNFWKNYVYLFAKSEFVIGQCPPAFIILFLRTCLCFLNSTHSHSKWSVVCGLILKKHVGSSVILNLWKYELSLPCPVTVVDTFMHICSLFDILSSTRWLYFVRIVSLKLMCVTVLNHLITVQEKRLLHIWRNTSIT
jgi:hypothetical protein